MTISRKLLYFVLLLILLSKVVILLFFGKRVKFPVLSVLFGFGISVGLPHYSLAQDKFCLPSKEFYQSLASSFRDRAIVYDPNNEIGFWKTDQALNVCWESSSDLIKYDKEIKAVELAIRNTWEKSSQLKFAGWKKCTASSKGIRIAIKNEQARTKCLGAALSGKIDGVILNFEFSDRWGKAIKKDFIAANYGKFDRTKLIQTIAIHEFGHAIGLAHMQERPDCNFCNEFPEFRRRDGQKNIGIWFTDCSKNYSIMNYCLSDYLNNGELSQYDKEVVQQLYGRSFTTPAKLDDLRLVASVSPTGIKVKPNAESVTELTKTHLDQPVGLTKYLVEHSPIQDSPHGLKANWSFVVVKLAGGRSELQDVEQVRFFLYERMHDDRYIIVASPERNFIIGFFTWGRFEVKAEIKIKGRQELLVRSVTPNVPNFKYTYKRELFPGNSGKGELPPELWKR